MPYKILASKDKQLIHIVRSGTISLEAVVDSWRDLADRFQAEGFSRLLSDCQNASFEEVNILQMDDLGLAIEQGFPEDTRIAVVCTGDQRRLLNHYANVCTSRGIRVRIFEELAEAENWLCLEDVVDALE